MFFTRGSGFASSSSLLILRWIDKETFFIICTLFIIPLSKFLPIELQTRFDLQNRALNSMLLTRGTRSRYIPISLISSSPCTTWKFSPGAQVLISMYYIFVDRASATFSLRLIIKCQLIHIKIGIVAPLSPPIR